MIEKISYIKKKIK